MPCRRRARTVVELYELSPSARRPPPWPNQATRRGPRGDVLPVPERQSPAPANGTIPVILPYRVTIRGPGPIAAVIMTTARRLTWPTLVASCRFGSSVFTGMPPGLGARGNRVPSSEHCGPGAETRPLGRPRGDPASAVQIGSTRSSRVWPADARAPMRWRSVPPERC